MFSEAREGKVEVCCEGIQLKGKINNIREKKENGRWSKIFEGRTSKRKRKKKSAKRKENSPYFSICKGSFPRYGYGLDHNN